MADALFSFSPFEFDGIQGGHGHVPLVHDVNMFGMEEWEEFGSLCSEYGSYQGELEGKGVDFLNDRQQQQHPNSDCFVLDDFHSNDVSPPVESKKKMQYPFALASLELLNNYRSRVRKLKREKVSNSCNQSTASDRRLSTEEIMRAAGKRFINFSSQGDVDLSILMHPYGYALSSLSEEETQDVELAHVLLAAAEKVGYQQFDSANRLLARCAWIATEIGNPVQRVVSYFANALQERIDRETGRVAWKGLQEKQITEIGQGLSYNLASIACRQELPFTQVVQHTGIQAVMEHVAFADKVHLIDLEIRSGVHWIVLMQALAARDPCHIELKITVVATRGKQRIEETGKRLESFAQSINLNFSFQIVFVSDMEHLKEEHFNVKADEVVVVYSYLILRTMISRTSCLDILMGVMKKLNPSIMVIAEVEANHNSTSFVNRFIEALFYYSAYFDCLEASMDRKNQNRTTLEAILGEGIQDIVANEGQERITRSVRIDVWRAFFARFGMIEIDLSESSLYQAGLVVKQFACGTSCTLDNDGKCLIVGWKGTPIHSLSAWRFC